MNKTVINVVFAGSLLLFVVGTYFGRPYLHLSKEVIDSSQGLASWVAAVSTAIGAIGTVFAFIGTIYLARTDKRTREKRESDKATIQANMMSFRIQQLRVNYTVFAKLLNNPDDKGKCYQEIAVAAKAFKIATMDDLSDLICLPNGAAFNLSKVMLNNDAIAYHAELISNTPDVGIQRITSGKELLGSVELCIAQIDKTLPLLEAYKNSIRYDIG